jgi:hypothetical protein
MFVQNNNSSSSTQPNTQAQVVASPDQQDQAPGQDSTPASATNEYVSQYQPPAQASIQTDAMDNNEQTLAPVLANSPDQKVAVEDSLSEPEKEWQLRTA